MGVAVYTVPILDRARRGARVCEGGLASGNALGLEFDLVRCYMVQERIRKVNQEIGLGKRPEAGARAEPVVGSRLALGTWSEPVLKPQTSNLKLQTSNQPLTKKPKSTYLSCCPQA
ncbi:hypothetical protein B0J17DRAFT_146424 [Rhizoctonia solani]|nr:hypothetical protein B0J17DRAFT_146424 [Rhizoctonia solani]